MEPLNPTTKPCILLSLLGHREVTGLDAQHAADAEAQHVLHHHVPHVTEFAWCPSHRRSLVVRSCTWQFEPARRCFARYALHTSPGYAHTALACVYVGHIDPVCIHTLPVFDTQRSDSTGKPSRRRHVRRQTNAAREAAQHAREGSNSRKQTFI